MSIVCGTQAGYSRHRRRQEAQCDPCRSAHWEYQQARAAAHGPCELPGCEKLVRAKRRCATHLEWLNKYGPDGRPPTKSELFWKQTALGPISIHAPELGECWLWTGMVGSGGYGKFARPGGSAHVFAYQDMVGSIPPGYTIDHLCMVKLCVNPYHLDPVPGGVNARRYWDHFRQARRTA